MSILDLTFASGESSLSVRKFAVTEAMNALFNITIEARSPNDDIDLESIVGKPAMFRSAGGRTFAHVDVRLWTGIVSEMELVRVEPNGLSTYALTIVPNLWMATQRVDNRLFQHLSAPEIVGTILDEWKVRHELRIARDEHPKLELRVQYGESDFAFICRLLSEAGISFYYEDDLVEGSLLVLHDRPHTVDHRAAPPLAFVDDPSLTKASEMEYVTEVRVGNKVRPGKLTIRDFDFRRPNFALFAESPTHEGIEARMEQYHYHPGAFAISGTKTGDTPTADDRGAVRHHHPVGHKLAGQKLEAHRSEKRVIRYKTNAADLAPGAVFTIAGHPRRDLSVDRKLVVTSSTFSGETGGEWTIAGTAAFADAAVRPVSAPPKPRIYGVQSAIVVGPKGEDVHTDEFGRIRVQFPWDRHGKHDERSSVWIRVSQPWAGPGYGMINLPRVGHEVLVGFLDGDPDNPIVVGRVFNGAAQVPYKLPDSKLMSAWKSDSNSNIILYVDIPGHEGFLEQAERDRLNVVKHDVFELIGNDVTQAIHGKVGEVVAGEHAHGILGDHTIITGGEYSVTSRATLSQTAGLELTMVSGYKWEASVTPLLPFVIANLAVGIIRSKIADAFPAGPPDLMAILQAQAAQMGWQPGMGLPPGVSVVAAIPVDAKSDIDNLIADFKGLFIGLIQPLLSLLGSLPPATLQQILAALAQAPDLASMLQMIEQVLPPPGPGGTSLGQLIADLTALFDKIMGALPNPQPAPGSQAPIQQVNQTEELLKKLKPIMNVFSEIMDEIAPGTSIRIQPDQIRLTTGKATIELKGEDIEIKTSGSIKLDGGSVSISPSPCKCG